MMLGDLACSPEIDRKSVTVIDRNQCASKNTVARFLPARLTSPAALSSRCRGFLFAAAAALLAPTAQAEGVCADRHKIADYLASDHGETPVAIGIAAHGSAIMEIFVNPETGSWSLMMTKPSGTGCLMATGTAFMAVSAPLGDPL